MFLMVIIIHLVSVVYFSLKLVAFLIIFTVFFLDILAYQVFGPTIVLVVIIGIICLGVWRVIPFLLVLPLPPEPIFALIIQITYLNGQEFPLFRQVLELVDLPPEPIIVLASLHGGIATCAES